MLLDAMAPCQGRHIAVSNRHAGICIGCARWHPRTRSPRAIEPAAAQDAEGVYQCINRRSSGHPVTVDLEQSASHP